MLLRNVDRRSLCRGTCAAGANEHTDFTPGSPGRRMLTIRPATGIRIRDLPDTGHGNFTCFWIVIGMTFQLSDVRITGKHPRRVLLLHSVAGQGS